VQNLETDCLEIVKRMEENREGFLPFWEGIGCKIARNYWKNSFIFPIIYRYFS
jgi:hypothetical protein